MSEQPVPERTQPNQPQGSEWSWKIFTVAGIPIRVHFTFVLLLIWLAYISLTSRNAQTAFVPVFVVGIFVCVLLHELGHSLVALKYGIGVQSITLYPIGGVAAIEKMPKPKQEFWIAIAGPAVNVVIAGLIYFGLKLTGSSAPMNAFDSPNQFWQKLMNANIYLVLFNMLPAFPMDGGRVLRAILGMNMPEEIATGIAARIGQGMAILIGLAGLLIGNPFMIFIAFFVYIAAGQEGRMYQQKAALEGVSVQQAMITDFRTLDHGATLQDAVNLLLSTSQHDFPVMYNGEPLGIFSRRALIAALQQEETSAYISGYVERNFVSAEPDYPLQELIEQLSKDGQSSALVIQRNQVIGMVTPENIQELLTVRLLTRYKAV